MLTYNLWRPEEEILLECLCKEGNLNYQRMASTYFPGRTGASLQGRAKAKNYPNNYRYRKHWHNERFFQELNPLNCYVAGFIAADGCVRKGSNTEAYLLAITLNEIDKELLENIKKWMDYTGPVRTYVRKAGWRHVTLCLNGITQIRNDLARHFGIVPRKAHRLPPPNLTDTSLKLAYLGGLLDGDGCIHIVKSTGQIVIKFTSCSRPLVEWALDVMKSFNFPEIKKKPSQVNALAQPNTYELTFSGSKAIHFIELMRRQNLPLLVRKWNNPTLNAAIAAYKARFPAHWPAPSQQILQVAV